MQCRLSCLTSADIQPHASSAAKAGNDDHNGTQVFNSDTGNFYSDFDGMRVELYYVPVA